MSEDNTQPNDNNSASSQGTQLDIGSILKEFEAVKNEVNSLREANNTNVIKTKEQTINDKVNNDLLLKKQQKEFQEQYKKDIADYNNEKQLFSSFNDTFEQLVTKVDESGGDDVRKLPTLRIAVIERFLQDKNLQSHILDVFKSDLEELKTLSKQEIEDNHAKYMKMILTTLQRYKDVDLLKKKSNTSFYSTNVNDGYVDSLHQAWALKHRNNYQRLRESS